MLAFFQRDRSGTVAILFGLMLPLLVAAGAGGLEIARALEYKERLVSAADLTCRQAQIYVGANVAANQRKDFTSDVQNIGNLNKNERKFTNATFTVTPQPSVKPTSILVTASGSSTLYFKTLLAKESIPLSVTRTCQVGPAGSPPGSGIVLVRESFEDNHSVASNGWTVLGTSDQSNTWNGWKAQNAGIEINGIPALTGDAIRFGNFFAELDSDCQGRSGCTHTNSAMSRTLTLAKGTTYQVRYWYVARKRPDVDSDPYPDHSVVCSTSASDTGTERDQEVDNVYNTMTKTGPAKDQQTRRIELYVEPKNTGYIDFTKGTNTKYDNLADVCIWSDDWTERLYTFTATQDGEYRITWAAAGKEDTYGGLIDYLTVCQNTCQ